MLLKGEVAVVTGAASERGIGRAVAKLFAEQGARVAILDLDREGAVRAAERLGPGHRGYGCSVTDRAAVTAALKEIAAGMGPPSILVNNAGITQKRRVDEISDSDFDAVVGVNLKGTFICSQAVLPYMRQLKRGRIINISSVSAERGGGIFGGAHYSAAKAGVMGLAKAMARELAPEGIRVNVVAPGFIDTDITAGKLSADELAGIARSVPAGRIGQPLDVAGACLFLASPFAGYVTGEVIDVNGGLHID